MKYTIEGFSQEKLIEFGLDVNDAIILRWFIDFKDTGKMSSEIIENDKYYWINYEALLRDLPIMNIKKDTLYRRLKKMESVQILKHFTKKQGGTYSMYAVALNYCQLIDFEGYGFKSEGYGKKSVGGTDLNPDGTDLNPEQKTNLLNQSISNINQSNQKSESKELISDLENKFKTKPSVIKMLAFDRNLILDQKFINSLRIYDIEFLTELFSKVPKGAENPAGYLITCLNNNPQPKVTKIKKETKVEPVIEEPKQELESRESYIQTYLENRELSQLSAIEKQILNKTLGRMGYESVS